MLTRRAFNRAGAVAALGVSAAALLDACGFAGGPAASAGNSSAKFSVPKTANLQIAWWGGSSRAQLTQKVMALAKEQHPGWTMAGQFAAYSDYWTKINTQAAAGSLPDVFQMDLPYITQYTSHNELLDLNKYRTDPLSLADFDKGQLRQGTVNGKLISISLGGNMDAVNYNLSAIQRAGMSPPAEDVSWEGFATYCSNLAKKLPSGMSALNDDSGSMPPFEVFMRQRRQSGVFTETGELNIKSSDVQDWFQYWVDLRKANLLITPDAAAAEITSDTPATDAIALGKAAFQMTWSNFIGQYQILMKDQVAMMRDPKGPAGSLVGDYTQPSLSFSVPATTKQADAAVEFISFFIHNPQAVRTLGVDRGVPPSAAARTALTPSLKPYDKAQVAFLGKFGGLTRDKTTFDPPAAGQVYTALTNASQAISLANKSVSEATSMFMEQAKAALAA